MALLGAREPDDGSSVQLLQDDLATDVAAEHYGEAVSFMNEPGQDSQGVPCSLDLLEYMRPESRWGVKRTPRTLKALSWGKIWSCQVTGSVSGEGTLRREGEKSVWAHLLGWKRDPVRSLHRVACRSAVVACEVADALLRPAVRNMMSSSQPTTMQPASCGSSTRSAEWKSHRIGERREPCGTPQVSKEGWLVYPVVAIDTDRWRRKASMKTTSVSGTSRRRRVARRAGCDTCRS